MVVINEKITPYSIAIGLIGLLLLTLFVQQIFLSHDSRIDETVKVGVVDSGCSKTQENHVLDYRSFTTKEFGFTYDDNALYDSVEHGSKVCQLIIDEAPDVALISAKIAISNQITYQAIIAAIDWLMEEHDVDFINLSLGSNAFIATKLSSVFEKYQNETLFIVSSGNQGNDNYYSDAGYIDWPAIYPWVVGVGASDPSNNKILAEYSSFGIGYYGTYVNQFVDNGGSGTSFSTPKITGKLAYFLLDLRSQKLNPSMGELLALFIATNYQDFSEFTGWGLPNQTQVDPGIMDNSYFYIHAPVTSEPLVRLSTEKWTRSWKISGYSVSNSMLQNYEINGNGSSMLEGVEIDQAQWGGILSLHFQAGMSPGNYEINLNFSSSNNLKYEFAVQNNTVGKILFDHRFSINGYGHPYGEFSRFEKFLRSSDYIVEHTPHQTTNNLSEYKLVILPAIGQNEVLNEFSISPELDLGLISDYVDYVSQGGKAIFLGYHTRFLNSTISTSLGQAFGVEQTNIEFGRYNVNDKSIQPTYITNITSQPIGEGVINFKFQGSEVIGLEEEIVEVAWGVTIEGGSVSRSIGLYGEIDLGYFLYFGGTATITNVFFNVANGINFDRFVINLVTLD